MVEHSVEARGVAGSNPVCLTNFNGDYSLIGKAPECDSGRRGFESH